jgi:L-fucose isomerase-like protein
MLGTEELGLTYEPETRLFTEANGEPITRHSFERAIENAIAVVLAADRIQATSYALIGSASAHFRTHSLTR